MNANTKKSLLRRLEEEVRLRRRISEATADALLGEWHAGATLDTVWPEYYTKTTANLSIGRWPAGYVTHYR
jgi:hypothetical protein